MTPNPLTSTILLATALLCGCVQSARRPPTAVAADGTRPPRRGVALLASSIGHDIPSHEVIAFTRACRLNLVVLDFAWITHHYPRTDFASLRDLCARLGRDGVAVAAMYRPRVLRPADAPAIHFALNPDGSSAAHHKDLCLAHDDSAAWAARWGKQILDELPAVDQVILYNLRPTCACPDCRDGRAQRHAESFLLRCRQQWAARRPGGILVGHVSVGTPYVKSLDTLYPFLPVLHQSAPDLTELKSLRAGHPAHQTTALLKVCWADQTDNDAADITRAVADCDQAQLGFVLWYYEWIFHSPDNRYDRRAVVEALGGDWPALRPHFENLTGPRVRPGQ